MTALILGSAYLAKESVSDAAKRILGPSWDAIGERVRAKVFGPRLTEVIGEAARIATEAGYEPKSVPGRILFPLLEYASHEDDDNLHAKWAALLANAARPGTADRILPSYVDTLRQLTPRQAHMIDWFYGQRQSVGPQPADVFHARISRETIEREFELSQGDYALLMTDLERMSVIRPTGQQFQDAWQREVYREVQLTAYGVRFLEACRESPSRKR